VACSTCFIAFDASNWVSEIGDFHEVAWITLADSASIDNGDKFSIIWTFCALTETWFIAGRTSEVAVRFALQLALGNVFEVTFSAQACSVLLKSSSMWAGDAVSFLCSVACHASFIALSWVA